ncbi:outer membrane protein assembly factor BamA [Flavobacterium sp. 90]|uniref:hypothetical protein n=1 Tax=unclassified Flavobacterium TaxID=196869 RepID=UPI000EABB7A8|nr:MULTISPECIES: hypothetical protein [unclassified Flavobacterium]RKR10861.1 outer membrane protein assembly factor BamA [Flavobacterium sp. 81]TCK54644.1 outer membrane protein assembly factor BamA [Flavobacterium sp. 90]
MKKLLLKPFLQLLIFCTSISCYAQNFHLKINGSTQTQTQTIDSLNYTASHTTIKSLFDELKNTSEKLSKKGYIDNQILETNKTNDSTYTTIIELNRRAKYIHIYIGRNKSFFGVSETNKDTLIIAYEEIENFLNQKIIDAEKRGFALSKAKLENIEAKNSIIYADLNFKSEKKRAVNSIILNQENNSKKDYFPKGHLKQLNKKYLNRTLNQETVKELYNDINSYEFVTQTKYPQILFTSDSTKIYTYIEKRKANTFDGYIGFSNDENKKLTLNGYLDIALLNTLHAGEQFSLYWKSDGNQQKTFNTKIEIPYIFQSSLGLKAQLNIFKQDSTFQNTKTSIDLGYFINYNTKIYLGYQSTESSDIQNTNNSTISDYKNSYTTSTFEYKKNNSENTLFPKKASINLIIGYGKRNTNGDPETVDSSPQFYTNSNLSYNFKIDKRNYIYINPQIFYLKSKNYITNELFRFGGINSIRGFSENSLQANFASMLLTEYRYIVSGNLYINSIIDYAIYQDLTQTLNPKKINNLTGIGIGTTIQTPSGLLRINLTNGTENIKEIQLFNTMVSICYNVKF